MFSLSFSFQGAAIAILLLLISIFITFIYKLNLKYKYQKYQLNSTTGALKNAQDILAKQNLSVRFKFNPTYFKTATSYRKKTIQISAKHLVSTSIYEQVNAVFLAYKYILARKENKKMINYQGYLNGLLTFCAYNLLWSLVMNFYIVVIISGTLFIILSIWLQLINYQIEKRAAILTKEFLLPLASGQNKKLLLSYLKYKKITTFFNISEVYSQSLITIVKEFKKWGHDE